MSKTREELLEELTKNVKENKFQHDMIVQMAGLGISPKKIQTYMESLEKIDEYKILKELKRKENN